ncbi:MAG: alpha-amylase family glycosyl hydrolase [bacterium]
MRHALALSPAARPLARRRPSTAPLGRALLGLALALASHASPAAAAAPDGDIEWDGVFADTTAQFVDPMRVRAGEPLTLTLRAWANDLTAARCVLYYNGLGQSAEAPMMRTPGDPFDHWRCTVQVPAGATEIYYRFALVDGPDTDWYDAGAPGDDWPVRGMSDEERAFTDFRLYVDLDTPAWSQGAAFYQIFPDRFFDGRPANNRLYPEDCFWYLDFAPADPDAPACAAHDVTPAPADQKRCLIQDDWTAPPNGGPCDYFGGDLPGVEQKLTYLDDLGVDAIYLNPVFRSPSNHKYDTMSYEEVDPRFGGTDALESLTVALHARGLRIIVDGVFNHVSDLGDFYNGWLNYGRTAAGVTGVDAYPESCGAWEAFFARDESGCAESPWSRWFQIWIGIDEYDVDRDGDRAEPATHTCGWAGLEFMPEIDYGHPDRAADSGPRTWLYGGRAASDPATARASLAGKWLADGQKMREALDGWRSDARTTPATSTTAATAATRPRPTLHYLAGLPPRGEVPSATTSTSPARSGPTPRLAASPTTGSARTYDAVMNYHYFATPVSCSLSGLGVHADPAECRDAFFAMKPTEPALTMPSTPATSLSSAASTLPRSTSPTRTCHPATTRPASPAASKVHHRRLASP